MKKRIILGLLVAALVFGAGAFFGRTTKKDVLITSSTAGASYSGGYEGASKSASAIRVLLDDLPLTRAVGEYGPELIVIGLVHAAPF